jgi:chromosome segregation ATPase
MLTLEQIRKLEAKVQRAVSFIAELKDENTLLKQKLETYQERIDELEVLITDYKEDQQEIEQGIKNALFHLDQLEDDIARPQAGVAVNQDSVSSQGHEDPEEIEDVEGKTLYASEETEDAEAEEESNGSGPPKKEGELDIF